MIEQSYCIAILELGLSKEEFFDLTPYEFSALVEHKRKIDKVDYSILRNVIYNAGLNLLRKKGEKEIPLFEEEKNESDYGISDIDKKLKEREELFGKKE